MSSLEKLAVIAAKRIIQSKALLFTAGAGMGADSGLPTFRGNEVKIFKIILGILEKLSNISECEDVILRSCLS